MFHIIDDQPIVLDTLQELIEFNGYDCLSFPSAKAYWVYFQDVSFVAPTAILSDFDMPAMNGLELIRQVHKHLPNQQAVIVSGNLNLPTHQTIESLHCCYLTKPYHPETLFSLLSTLTSRERLCREQDSLAYKQAILS